MSNEYTVEQVRDAASSVSSAWCKRDPLVRAPRCLKAADMLRAYAALLERQASALNLLSDDEVEWLNYAIAHMHDDSEPEDKTCAAVLQHLLDRTHYPPAQASAVPDDPVAVIGRDWQLLYAGGDAIASIVLRHGLKIGSKLYAAPQPSKVQPIDLQAVREVIDELLSQPFIDRSHEWRAEIANKLSRAIG